MERFKTSYIQLVINIMVRHNYRNDKCAKLIVNNNDNDPYAGSPTNTLLRLLLPLNDPV